jgi:hypothetical protein
MNGWRTAAIVLVLALAGAAGCGGGGREEYSADAEQAFMSSCTAEPKATQTYCRCVLDNLEESMSFDEFKRVDAAIRVGGVDAIPEDSKEKFIDAVSACTE